MQKVKLPFGGVVFSPDSERTQRIINRRAEVTLEYMKKKGWGDDVTTLSFDQILEIREQPEWQNASGDQELDVFVYPEE